MKEAESSTWKTRNNKTQNGSHNAEVYLVVSLGKLVTELSSFVLCSLCMIGRASLRSCNCSVGPISRNLGFFALD